MEVSIILGKAFAIYFIVLAFAIWQNKDLVSKLAKEAKASNPIFFMFGTLVLLLGIFFVLLHNVWEGGWQIVVSVICWATLVKGVAYLLIPDQALDLAKKWNTKANLNISALAVLIIGLYLGYQLFVL